MEKIVVDHNSDSSDHSPSHEKIPVEQGNFENLGRSELPPDPDAHLSEAERAAIVSFLVIRNTVDGSLTATAHRTKNSSGSSTSASSPGSASSTSSPSSTAPISAMRASMACSKTCT